MNIYTLQQILKKSFVVWWYWILLSCAHFPLLYVQNGLCCKSKKQDNLNDPLSQRLPILPPHLPVMSRFMH